MEMDESKKDNLMQDMDLSLSLSNGIITSYNFNCTCKYWLQNNCKFGAECYFQHKLIKINIKCKYDQNCKNECCLFMHTGEIWDGPMQQCNNT